MYKIFLNLILYLQVTVSLNKNGGSRHLEFNVASRNLRTIKAIIIKFDENMQK